jgi:hypothetical protein
MEAAGAELGRRAGEVGIRLRRLDGRQAPAFAATLPLGGSSGSVPGSGPSPAARVRRLPIEPPEDLELPLSPGGVVLGSGPDGEPVALQLFRPGPTRVVLITASYVARLLALRALTAGASMVLSTPRPAGWQPVLDGWPARTELVLPGGVTTTVSGSADRPVLHCEESGSSWQVHHDDRGGWQSSVLVLDPIMLAGSASLFAADLLVLQRLDADQVDLLRRIVPIPDDIAGWLPQMPDDMAVVIGGGRTLWCALAPTDLETRLLGRPTRVDG